ncbi:hypothetical protein DEU56DRAFT_912190 [Suillus clintonianus]|uniref:uncharacterized protein n=1 Tax=Suillus clintonianus TaxID=1904413 RepID=UPI001B86B2E0|nr:uncharacterized protein DEU56DRAFT_912190 [Suillus clintonianus]KAG2139350.1 hypothetical protein DEU56DRAFT_912190 [Suillus clintonianus]
MIDFPPTTQEIQVMAAETWDVSIMMEAPSANSYSLPNDHQSEPAPLTLSTVAELDMDLATNIISVKVSKQSETIEWSDGHTTVLPCVWEDGVNICKDEVTFIRFLTQLPQTLPGSAYIIHAQYYD